MAGSKEIKRRIKSVKNTKKITKAMELVSAAKMKRAVSSALASRAYARASWAILESLSTAAVETEHPLLKKREVKNALVVLITSNRSLAGGYNSQITKKVISLIKEYDKNVALSFVSVGKKGEAALRRTGQNIVASFTDIPDSNVSFRDVVGLGDFLIQEFQKGTYDKVYVAYTDYESALVQTPTVRPLLPVSKEKLKEFGEGLGGSEATSYKLQAISYSFEPSYEVLMSRLVEKLARSQVFQMLLESFASEHSARMLAMKNASDAAGDMIYDLTLEFNKARQAAITKEISEISAGMASVS